jgi:uncharacterized membrane protein (DUF4010 family)
VLVLAAIASPALVPALAAPAVVGAATTLLAAGRGGVGDAPGAIALDGRRPLRLREALLVTTLLLAVSAGVSWLQARFGAEGLLAGAALAALADAHAPIAAAFGLHASGTIGVSSALHVVLVAVGVNTASRCVVAMASGGVRYGARVATGLVVSTGAAAATLLLLPAAATLPR